MRPILAASLGADLFVSLRLVPEIVCGSVAGGSPQDMSYDRF